MKVEIVSIGTELLVSDILDTNSAYISRSLREVNVELTCKTTVGDHAALIADVLEVALRRADLVITTGGIGTGRDDFTRQAVSAVTQRPLTLELPGIEGAIRLGDGEARMSGFQLDLDERTLVCLPGNRREMSYLLETKVLPLIRQQLSSKTSAGWTILRCVGLMESNLKQQLSDLAIDPQHRITFDSFGGQTTIRLWVQANSQDDVHQELERMAQIVRQRLGDHVFGGELERLEDVVLRALVQNNVHLTVAECHTNHIFADAMRSVANADEVLTIVPYQTWYELADYLILEAVTQTNLTQWCRRAAEQLKEKSGSDLSLVVYSNMMQGGVQILVTLASTNGVSVTQRSFGGHPDNIDQWALTLGLSHLRRWLLMHYESAQS
jgi:nicotinamide-nucleotide amidase